MMKIYVGCALTSVPIEFVDAVINLKQTLRSEGYEILDFVGTDEPDFGKIYDWDIKNCVKNCDAFVAICDYPSLGLGFELGEATRLKKPILALAAKDAVISKLIRGAAKREPHFTFKRYKDLQTDIALLVNDWLKPE